MKTPADEHEPQQVTAYRSEGDVYSQYSDEPRPLNSYLALVGVYAGAAMAVGLLMKRKKREAPNDVPVKDVALIGVATHKLSRIITHDEVTSPLRAPFARLQEETGASEVMESPRGDGLQRAIGDLITCPWCIGTWIGSAFMASYVFWPRQTRVVAGLFTAVALSDFLYHGYVKAKESLD